MSPLIEYRNLKPSHYDDIVAVWNESGLPCRIKGRDSREALTREMKRMPELFLGAFSAEKLIGTVIGTYDGRKGCVNRLAVLPSFRRQGIAEKLISLCEERLRKMDAKVICCFVEKYNAASFTLFTKLGYHLHDDMLYLSKRDGPEY